MIPRRQEVPGACGRLKIPPLCFPWSGERASSGSRFPPQMQGAALAGWAASSLQLWAGFLYSTAVSPTFRGIAPTSRGGCEGCPAHGRCSINAGCGHCCSSQTCLGSWALPGLRLDSCLSPTSEICVPWSSGSQAEVYKNSPADPYVPWVENHCLRGTAPLLSRRSSHRRSGHLSRGTGERLPRVGEKHRGRRRRPGSVSDVLTVAGPSMSSVLSQNSCRDSFLLRRQLVGVKWGQNHTSH